MSAKITLPHDIPSLKIEPPDYFEKNGKKYSYVCEKHKIKAGSSPLALSIRPDKEDADVFTKHHDDNWLHFCNGCWAEFFRDNIGEMDVVERTDLENAGA